MLLYMFYLRHAYQRQFLLLLFAMLYGERVAVERRQSFTGINRENQMLTLFLIFAFLGAWLSNIMEDNKRR